MDSIARLSELAQRFLVERPKELERPSGFVKRSTAQLDGPKFVQMCVLGWMNNASASYSQLNHVVASLEPVSNSSSKGGKMKDDSFTKPLSDRCERRRMGLRCSLLDVAA